MPSLNKVFLMGNLTREPELRYTPSNAAICEFGIAVNRRYVQNGQDREDPCFVDIIVWEKQADSCARFLHKGSSVFIEGRLQYDQWTDKEQKRRSRLRVTAERVQFLDRRDQQGAPADGGDSSQAAPAPQGGAYSAPRRQTPRDDGSQEPTFQRQGAWQPRRSYQPQQAPVPNDSIPPQMPADDGGSQVPPERPAPAAAKEQPPVPPVPPENVPPIEDDIPF